jgi:hypothetical protein
MDIVSWEHAIAEGMNESFVRDACGLVLVPAYTDTRSQRASALDLRARSGSSYCFGVGGSIGSRRFVWGSG